LIESDEIRSIPYSTVASGVLSLRYMRFLCHHTSDRTGTPGGPCHRPDSRHDSETTSDRAIASITSLHPSPHHVLEITSSGGLRGVSHRTDRAQSRAAHSSFSDLTPVRARARPCDPPGGHTYSRQIPHNCSTRSICALSICRLSRARCLLLAHDAPHRPRCIPPSTSRPTAKSPTSKSCAGCRESLPSCSRPTPSSPPWSQVHI
jgi:hypothetical protein